MGRLIAMAAVLFGLVFLTRYYAPQEGADAFRQGAFWALRPLGFYFWFTAGLVGFLAAHRGGDALYIVPLIFIGVGAVFGFFALRDMNLPELREARAPIVLLVGLAIAYGAKPENWLVLLAAVVGGASCGYLAGGAIGGRLDDLGALGGFSASLAIYMLGGMVAAEACGLAKNGGALRARLGAAAAGVGFYLTARVFDLAPGGLPS